MDMKPNCPDMFAAVCGERIRWLGRGINAGGRVRFGVREYEVDESLDQPDGSTELAMERKIIRSCVEQCGEGERSKRIAI